MSFLETLLLTKEKTFLPALCYENTVLSYQELASAVYKTSAYFREKGITKKDRVALQPNLTPNAIIAIFALLQLEASPCLLSTRHPKESIESLIQFARCSFFLETDPLSVQRLPSFDSSFDQQIVLFTSGSSGMPKLACLSLDNFIQSALGSYQELRLNQSSYLLSVPLFHVSGLAILFRALVSASSILIEPLLSPDLCQATHCSLVPVQLIRLLEKNGALRFPHIQSLLVGGAPLSEALIKKAKEQNLPIQTTYGLTEMASQVTLSCLDDPLFPTHAGKVLPGREILIAPDGEIFTRGLTLFSGYDKGEKIEKTLTEEGWFATKDLGRINSNGNLEYLGRKDLMFISGGENIYPEEIEKALRSMAGVYEAIVVAVQDLEYGERPVAFLRMEGAIPPKQEIYEELSRSLAKFCFPLAFFPFPEFSSPDLKVKRKDLQALACRYLS